MRTRICEVSFTKEQGIGSTPPTATSPDLQPLLAGNARTDHPLGIFFSKGGRTPQLLQIHDDACPPRIRFPRLPVALGLQPLRPGRRRRRMKSAERAARG